MNCQYRCDSLITTASLELVFIASFAAELPCGTWRYLSKLIAGGSLATKEAPSGISPGDPAHTPAQLCTEAHAAQHRGLTEAEYQVGLTPSGSVAFCKESQQYISTK